MRFYRQTFQPADSKAPPVTEAAQINSPESQNIRDLWADFLRAIVIQRLISESFHKRQAP